MSGFWGYLGYAPQKDDDPDPDCPDLAEASGSGWRSPAAAIRQYGTETASSFVDKRLEGDAAARAQRCLPCHSACAAMPPMSRRLLTLGSSDVAGSMPVIGEYLLSYITDPHRGSKVTLRLEPGTCALGLTARSALLALATARTLDFEPHRRR